MIFVATAIMGAYVIEAEPYRDPRGSFSRTFCQREFAAHGIALTVVQCNLARTTEAGTVRGLHYQEPPAAECKLVRCAAGAVLDALVDMRPDSPTYRAVYQHRLDAESGAAIYVPSGIAHGYQTLMDDTEFFYMTDQFYEAGLERGVRFCDPALGIRWPLPVTRVTERDRNWPLLD